MSRWLGEDERRGGALLVCAALVSGLAFCAWLLFFLLVVLDAPSAGGAP